MSSPIQKPPKLPSRGGIPLAVRNSIRNAPTQPMQDAMPRPLPPVQPRPVQPTPIPLSAGVNVKKGGVITTRKISTAAKSNKKSNW